MSRIRRSCYAGWYSLQRDQIQELILPESFVDCWWMLFVDGESGETSVRFVNAKDADQAQVTVAGECESVFASSQQATQRKRPRSGET